MTTKKKAIPELHRGNTRLVRFSALLALFSCLGFAGQSENTDEEQEYGFTMREVVRKHPTAVSNPSSEDVPEHAYEILFEDTIVHEFSAVYKARYPRPVLTNLLRFTEVGTVIAGYCHVPTFAPTEISLPIVAKIFPECFEEESSPELQVQRRLSAWVRRNTAYLSYIDPSTLKTETKYFINFNRIIVGDY